MLPPTLRFLISSIHHYH